MAVEDTIPNGTPDPSPAPAATPPVDMDALRAAVAAEMRPAVEAELRRQMAPVAAPNYGAVETDDQRRERYESLMYSDPLKFVETIRKEALGEVVSVFGSDIASVRQRNFVGAFGDLNSDGQAYMMGVAEKIGMPDLSKLDPQTRDVFHRAALHAQTEAAAKRPAPPALPTGAEFPYSAATATITPQDRKDFGPYIEQHGEEKFLELKRNNPD